MRHFEGKLRGYLAVVSSETPSRSPATEKNVLSALQSWWRDWP
jgi:hypothetical protein